MAKITKAGGPSYGEEGPPNGVVPAQATGPGELAPSAPEPEQNQDPAVEVDPDSAPAPDSGERYEVLTVVELRQLIHARNSQRDEDEQLIVSGNKQDLIDRLQADDDNQADKEQDEDGDEA